MFEAVTTENTPLEEKQVADIMKKWNENKDEVKDFVTELGNAENLQKIQAIAKNHLTLATVSMMSPRLQASLSAPKNTVSLLRNVQRYFSLKVWYARINR